MDVPILLACIGINRKRVLLGRAEQRAVDLHQSCLESRFLAGVERANHLESSDIAGIDFVERGVTLRGQSAVVTGPIRFTVIRRPR